MPRLLDTGTRTDAIIDATSRLILTRGVDALSLRAIAAETGLSASTLLHHLTDRTRLLRLCAARFVKRHMDEVGYRVRLESEHALLPRTPEEIRDMRVWFAWRELGRSDDGIAHFMADYREQERLLLGVTLRRRSGTVPEEPELDAAMAVATAAFQWFLDHGHPPS